ncbi:MAG: DNA mismatch repair protein MutS [Caulobacterales bacterium]|nr:DNA mismatch repair protein MutS [Caulobacterales bacterium]
MNAPSPPPVPADASPMMAQYLAAKARQPDALLFFRMGDFYELFFEDAETAAGVLGITLTRRGKHQGGDIPMAGVPVHAMDGYLARLIRAGFKVAVCEQMEDPAEAKKRGSKAVVRRDVVRVVTPGTLTEDSLLEAGRANRLAAVAVRGDRAALATVELSTGEVESLPCARDQLGAVLAAVRPSETLAGDRLFADEVVAAALKASGGVVQPMAQALAEPGAARDRVERLYGAATLDGFGDFEPAEIAALGLIAAYIETTQAGRLPALKAPRRLAEAGFMAIDQATRLSLEIDRTQTGAREGSLIAAVDRTVTAPGARRLTERISRPLSDPAAIEARLDAVGWLVERRDHRRALRAALKGAPDLARALSRLALGRGGPRDLAALRDGLARAASVQVQLAGDDDPLSERPAEIRQALDALSPDAAIAALAGDLERALIEQPGHLARDGGFVAKSWSDDLDAARALRDDSRKVIADLEARYQIDSGLPFRAKHNAVLGYFLEIAPKHAEDLIRQGPESGFIHRQTLANQVRFTTVELAELDAKIARAGDRALAMEIEIFDGLRQQAVNLAEPLRAKAEALAELDVAAALAEWAEEARCVRPVIDRSAVFEVQAGRHPVVEAAVTLAGEPFTPNACSLDGAGEASKRLMIVTGPNMAGKSTFLRQNALLAVLAQSGCFVPAASMRLGVVDRLFSRVGAGDDLSRGRSTFMTEMVETAAILTQATDRSLVVLDEIGRGTATYDGLAIAWACAEYLHDQARCRTLFATHYHELARLEERLEHLGNLSMRAKEWNGELVFLHEAGPGAADRSYGVQVAKLAGVPAPVVARARAVLERLEGQEAPPARLDDLPLFAVSVQQAEPPRPSPLEALLDEVEPDDLTPREALDWLYRLKGVARS